MRRLVPRSIGASVIVIALLVAPLVASAAPLAYDGTLRVVELDTGAGTFAGTSIGATFSIRTSDVRADGSFDSGSVRSGATVVPIACPGPTVLEVEGERCSPLAAGPGFENDVVLDTDTANLLNAVFGPGTFSAGQSVDLVDLEGDSGSGGGDRLEAGLSFLFPASTYSGGPRFQDLSPPFDPSLATHVLFFVVEEQGGTDVYSVLGDATLVPTPVPLQPWALSVLAAGLAAAGHRALRPGSAAAALRSPPRPLRR